MKIKKPQWLLNSRAYKKASSLVKEKLSNSEYLAKFLNKARQKFDQVDSPGITSMSDSVFASFRLLKSYVTGEYREVSYETLALIMTSIIYFVMPLDAVPDFLLGFGYLDDVALLAWTFRSVSKDLDEYLAWEDAGKPVIIGGEATEIKDDEEA